MNKKFRLFTVAIIAALLIVLVLPSTALAADKERIVDYTGVLSDSELRELNDYAQEISRQYQLDVAFFLASNTYASDQTLEKYAEECYTQHKKLGQNGFMLAVDEESPIWTWVCFGSAADTVTDDSIGRFLNAYDTEADLLRRHYRLSGRGGCISGVDAWSEKAGFCANAHR
ncbi:MAG: TPM domain-containing protein [Christensenellales bacterium]|jgi:uncharacterized membrane protein YgcG